MSKKNRKWLKIALLGSVLALLGDLFLGTAAYPETGNYYTALIASCGSLSDLRLGLGAFFGVLGIPFAYFGFRALELLLPEAHRKWLKYGACAMAFWGPAVHALCVAFMLSAKTELVGVKITSSDTLLTLMTALPNSLDLALYIAVPAAVLLMIPYTIACVVLFADVLRGRTPLPRWACVFNPLLMKILLNGASGIAPNAAWYNGLRMSNMSFGALVTFAAALAFVSTSKEE